MTYTIKQLAPGSYDVLLDGALVASLVREVDRSEAVRGWSVELLDEMSSESVREVRLIGRGV